MSLPPLFIKGRERGGEGNQTLFRGIPAGFKRLCCWKEDTSSASAAGRTRLQPLLQSQSRLGPPSSIILPKKRVYGITVAQMESRRLEFCCSWSSLCSQIPRLLGRSERRLGQKIWRSFLGGAGRGRRACECRKTSSILLCRLSFSSQLPLPLCLFSTETVPPKPLPFTPAPANHQLKGHKAATTPHLLSPSRLCVSQNYPETTLSKRTGFRGDSEEKPDLLPEPWEPVQSRGGHCGETMGAGNSPIIYQAVQDQRCNLLIINGSI